MRDERRIYIVAPFCNGGELFDVVAERGRLEEDEARPLFRQALRGLLFLKKRGVCHRCATNLGGTRSLPESKRGVADGCM